MNFKNLPMAEMSRKEEVIDQYNLSKRFNLRDQEGRYSCAKMQAFINRIDCRVARTRNELEQAYALVYKEYLKRGYEDESSPQIRFSLYNLFTQTTTLVASAEQNIVATATLIPDSSLGLPIDELYKEELDGFRQQNKKVCEVSMLASDTSLFREGTSVMLNAKKMFLIFILFKLILDYAKDHLHADYMVITINPKHRLTYECLQFTDLGPIKHYDKVKGAPGLGKVLEVKTAHKKLQKGRYKMFFSGKTDPVQFSHRKFLTLEDIKYFFSKKTDLLLKASSDQLNFIKECYPSYNFSEIISHNVAF